MAGLLVFRLIGNTGVACDYSAGSDFHLGGYASSAGWDGNQRGAVSEDIFVGIRFYDSAGNGIVQGNELLQRAAAERGFYAGGAGILYGESPV